MKAAAHASAGVLERAPAYGIGVFWISCGLVLLGFWVPGPIGVLLLMFIVPVFYGAHEALHDTLIPKAGWTAVGRKGHNTMACLVGFALQGMNVHLLKPAHLHHHTYGRYDEGYSPDVVPGTPSHWNRFRYYLSLIGLPAVAWQLAGFACLFLPARHLPFVVNLRLRKGFGPSFFVSQAAALAFFAYAILTGGWLKWILFEISFCFVWSVLQNVSHYGLRGVDPPTDRVCARTYLLEWPFRVLTFGSTSHLAHHVDMHVPGLLLHETYVLREIEERLGIEFEVKHGILSFVADVLRQFKGPMAERDLSTSWIKSAKADFVAAGRQAASFGVRSGRKWTPEPPARERVADG